MANQLATDLFSEWAIVGRDEGMEKGHTPSVDIMLQHLLKNRKTPFSAIDIGCGNGWVVRRLTQHPLCCHATGVDGASAMIEKARQLDPHGDYIEAMLPDWRPEQPVDLIHSMECLYYLHDPLTFLGELKQYWITSGGKIVIGVDHYAENPSSLDWGNSLQVHMTTLGIEAWIHGLQQAGFVDVQAMQVGEREGWAGTLVLIASAP